MSVAHIVLHAFGSWHPDHADGWHQHQVPQTLKPAPGIGVFRRGIQKHERVTFSTETQAELIAAAQEVCSRRGWRCHSVAVNETHVHIVASGRDGFRAEEVQNTLKRVLGLHLARVSGVGGRKWFSRGGRPTGVVDNAHLDFLLGEYLPKQGGTFWRECRS